jgi:hypothetical protein
MGHDPSDIPGRTRLARLLTGHHPGSPALPRARDPGRSRFTINHKQKSHHANTNTADRRRNPQRAPEAGRYHQGQNYSGRGDHASNHHHIQTQRTSNNHHNLQIRNQHAARASSPAALAAASLFLRSQPRQLRKPHRSRASSRKPFHQRRPARTLRTTRLNPWNRPRAVGQLPSGSYAHVFVN